MMFDGIATGGTESRSGLARQRRRLLASAAVALSALTVVAGSHPAAAETPHPVAAAAAETHVPMVDTASETCEPVVDTPPSAGSIQYSRDDIERAMDQIPVTATDFGTSAVAAIAADTSTSAGAGVFKNFKAWAVSNSGPPFDGVTVSGDYINAPTEGVCAADAALARALTAMTGVTVKINHQPIFWATEVVAG